MCQKSTICVWLKETFNFSFDTSDILISENNVSVLLCVRLWELLETEILSDGVQTLQVVLLGDGQRQQANVAEGRRPVVAAQVDQTKLGGSLRVGEGQHHHQEEAHCQDKLQRQQGH